MKPKKTDMGRLDRLERREDKLDKELKRLEKEEKALEKKLMKLEAREMELVKMVSELERVKKRRPNFLINYMRSRDKESTEIKPIPATVRRKERRSKKILEKVLMSHPPKEIEEKREEGKGAEEERKKLLKAQIKKVLEKRGLVKKEERRRKEMLESQVPIKELRMDGKTDDSMRLFQVLLSTGTMTMDEAGRQLNVDKDTIKKWAKNLEDTGIIEVTTPLRITKAKAKELICKNEEEPDGIEFINISLKYPGENIYLSQ